MHASGLRLYQAILMALLLAACNPSPAAKHSAVATNGKERADETKGLPIEPNSLSELKPVELSMFVLAAMPMAGSTALGWDHMLHAPIRWTTDGFKTTETGAKIRDGMARVRVHGRVSTVLKQTKEELPWTIEMDSTTNENFGPQEITIQPGNPDGGQCFGSLYDNCTFTPDEAFTSTILKAQFLCQVGEANNYTRYYRLTARDRAEMIAAYSYSEASGGTSTDLSLTLASNRSPSVISNNGRPECAAKRD